jgi:putative transposase
MRKSRFTRQQIIGLIMEHESGISTIEVYRNYEISNATFCKHYTKFGGMCVSDAWKPKTPEEDNARHKRFLAETTLDVAIMKNTATKNYSF